MGNLPTREQVARELPADMQYVYDENPDSQLPTWRHLSLVRDRAAGHRASAASVTYISGLLQTKEAAAHTVALPFHGESHPLSPADADRLVRFRADEQKLAQTLPTTFIVAHAGLTALPAELRRPQVQHLLDLAWSENHAWVIRYIPEETVLPKAIRDVHISTVDLLPRGFSAYVEANNVAYDENGVAVGINSCTEQYMPAGSREANRVVNQIAVLGKLALSPQASVVALSEAYRLYP